MYNVLRTKHEVLSMTCGFIIYPPLSDSFSLISCPTFPPLPHFHQSILHFKHTGWTQYCQLAPTLPCPSALPRLTHFALSSFSLDISYLILIAFVFTTLQTLWKAVLFPVDVKTTTNLVVYNNNNLFSQSWRPEVSNQFPLAEMKMLVGPCSLWRLSGQPFHCLWPLLKATFLPWFMALYHTSFCIPASMVIFFQISLCLPYEDTCDCIWSPPRWSRIISSTQAP